MLPGQASCRRDQGLGLSSLWRVRHRLFQLGSNRVEWRGLVTGKSGSRRVFVRPWPSASKAAVLSPRSWLARLGSPSALSPLRTARCSLLLVFLLRFAAGSFLLLEMRLLRRLSLDHPWSLPQSLNYSSCRCRSSCLSRTVGPHPPLGSPPASATIPPDASTSSTAAMARVAILPDVRAGVTALVKMELCP